MRTFVIFALVLFLYSCTEKSELPQIVSKFNNGLFVANEGNYTWSNASISYIDLDSNSVENTIYLNANRMALGDVVQSLYAVDSLLFIVVNNSSKIEIVSLNNFKRLATITGFASPRYVLQIDDTHALVSDLYSKYLKVINFHTFEITDSVYLGKSSENLLLYNEHVFVTNWSKLGMAEIENNTVQIVHKYDLQLIDSVVVHYEPCGLQMDMDENLWVLCSGNFTNTDKPAIIKINPINFEIIHKIEFPQNSAPKNLIAANEGDAMYYLNTHLYRFEINSSILPDQPFIESGNTNFYNVAISPFTGNLFISDVVDYVQDGFIYIYNHSGIPVDTFQVKVNPSDMLFVNRN